MLIPNIITNDGSERTGVGEGDFIGLIGVEPESLLTASQDGSSQSLLESQVDHLRIFIF